MDYRRFLTNRDYLAIITEEGLEQLIREVPDRIPQAEMAAEMKMLEYLDQYYEIEKALAVGKSIRDYSYLISYPSGVYFKKNEVIYQSLTAINGIKKPTLDTYWTLVEDYAGIDLESVKKYSQLKTYNLNDLVSYGTEYYRCAKPNGFDFNNIRIPGVNAWVEVEHTPWEPNDEHAVNDVVSFNGHFYTLLTTEDIDLTVNPHDSDNWGLIGDYTTSVNYDFGEDSTDYVVSDNTVFKAVINPNADVIEVGVNIAEREPRNLNVITHMTRISLYYLHQLISPTNISETRRLMYEDSLTWLLHASKFKLNPQIPRKIDRDSGDPKSDFAMASFERQYNPNEDNWYI